MQPVTSPSHKPGTRGVLPSALFVGALMALSLNTLASAAGDHGAGARPTQAVAAERPAWSHAQVAALIEEIAAARTLGLNPEDYGLAALKGQLELTEEFLGRTGSRQLDALADTAALSLARDYRYGRSFALNAATPQATPSERAALRAALRSGSIRSWLQSHRRDRLPRFQRPQTNQGV